MDLASGTVLPGAFDDEELPKHELGSILSAIKVSLNLETARSSSLLVRGQ